MTYLQSIYFLYNFFLFFFRYIVNIFIHVTRNIEKDRYIAYL